MPIGNLAGIIDLRAKLPSRGEYRHRTPADLGPDGLLRWLVIHHGPCAPSGALGPVHRDYSARAIARYHVIDLGGPGIAFHFLVHRTGRVEYVGDILTVRDSVPGQGRHVISACLMGDFTHRPPARRQLVATRELLASLRHALG